MPFVLLIFFSVSGAYTSAAPLCLLKRDVIAAPSEVTRYLLRVDVIGNPDRKSAKDFAKENQATAEEISKRYAASGDLQCGTSVSQAQLVIKNNLVLVANHGLPGSPCIDEKALNKCKVTFTDGGKPKQFEVKRLVKGGFTCKPGFLNMDSEDWAVLELKDPVGTKIKPYGIKTAPCASNAKPIDVVAVGKSIDVGPAPAKGWSGWAKHYGNCQLRLGDCGQRFPVLLSDCDTSGGSSGGGMFVGGSDPQLIGVVSSSGKSCDVPHPEKFGPYDELCWNSAYAPIAGELKTLLESVADTSKSPKELPAERSGSDPKKTETFQDL